MISRARRRMTSDTCEAADAPRPTTVPKVNVLQHNENSHAPRTPNNPLLRPSQATPAKDRSRFANPQLSYRQASDQAPRANVFSSSRSLAERPLGDQNRRPCHQLRNSYPQESPRMHHPKTQRRRALKTPGQGPRESVEDKQVQAPQNGHLGGAGPPPPSREPTDNQRRRPSGAGPPGSH